MATKTILSRINTQLKAAGLSQRLVRGRGYYYVTDVAVSSMLCWWRMDNSSDRDYRGAVDHVNQVLREEGLGQFQVK